ncbi:MAG: hypothetical protein COU90_04145 [Candidatus Ryanbacteria bacterium CG10_big_fil_rev_8_21_14_0_10_43_42]|uniref:Dockerin domain-containing protein n=1 Tax=Candidatus Ryanbacteria bacterium CG10_big_fil_rev_8_21_14_0_10_43_42 TaxID=1974864 RepID=A0A2M8KW69_9BACT|nr:MAG: hypothetical protein COU90_04145 [Candidatus Ryanbacteria bacterium CG10_big_fil_rev_8_21_14_0_10_43_42]
MKKSAFLFVFLSHLPMYAQEDRLQLKILSHNSRQWENLHENIPLFDESAATCLITHGWTLFFNEQLNGWMLDIARDISTRTDKSGNILAWEWIEEADGSNNGENESAREQAVLLADALKTSVPIGYDKAMHFMGHSLGTILVTHAARELVDPVNSLQRVIRVHQITLWDPLDTIILVDLAPIVSILRRNMVYVDLYRGITSVNDNRANLIVNVPGVSHSVYNWYATTITGENTPVVIYPKQCINDNILSGSLGFENSVFLAGSENPYERMIHFPECDNTESMLFASKISICQADTGDEVFGIDERRHCGNATELEFVRGDSNTDGDFNLSDTIRLLDVLFRGGDPLTCADAADANDDGLLDISDAVFILLVLFSDNEMPLPFPDAGPDPTDDPLGCENYTVP